MLVVLFILCCTLTQLATSVSLEGAGDMNLFEEPVSYDVETTVLLNEVARKDKEVSFMIRAKLNIVPVWSDPGSEVLLKLELLSPYLLSRGKLVTSDFMPVKSIWDSYSHSTFYAHRKHGLIETAYLDSDEPLDIQNLKKSLISLLQFQTVDGETNETDMSGTCEVQYETASANTIRKYKRGCIYEEGEGDREVSSRRVTRYSLSAARDALSELHAEELHELGGTDGGLKARAWVRLRSAGRAAGGARAGSLEDALAGLPSSLRPAPLRATLPEISDPLVEEESPERELSSAAAVARDTGGGEAGAGGGRAGGGGGPTPRAGFEGCATTRAGRAAGGRHGPRTPVRRYFTATSPLQYDGSFPGGVFRLGVVSSLGAVAAAHTHAAAARFLRLRAGDAPPALAHAYLDALALAPTPEESVVEDVLRLGEEMKDPSLGESALLAGAAAARGLRGGAARARDALAKSLARCKDDECRRVRIVALGNLRRDDTVELLLEHAEGGARPVALAALDALDALLPAVRLPARLRRLEELALSPRPLVVRAAALDLLLRCSADAPFGLPRVLLQLHDTAPPELLRLVRQRLASLAERHAPVQDMLRLLPLRLRSWDAQAGPGTSSVLVRELGAAGRWSARLESVQVASGGLLQRGRVGLVTVSPDDDVDDALTIDFWTRGLEALVGDDAASGEDEEQGVEASGGLALAVGGARTRSLTLFTGRGELLGHVWAGTGSSPTAVLRAQRPARGARRALPLAGGAALLLERDALQALALDAAAQVSLWSRSARAQLSLRGALSVSWGARVVTAGASLTARATLQAEPRLHVAPDLDFYDGNALCVRVHTDDYKRSYNVSLVSEVGPRHVWRSRRAVVSSPGRTLSLGRINDSLCRVLTPAL